MATANNEVLVGKVFNYVLDNRCFVIFSDFLKVPSPLATIKPPRVLANWIRNHLHKDEGFSVHENNGRVISVKIVSRVRLCFRYVMHGKHNYDGCKFWHVCKDHIEGNCAKNCPHGFSHDFHDAENSGKTEELGFAKLENDVVRRIVACNLPQICSAYMQGSCVDTCRFLHLCAGFVKQTCTGIKSMVCDLSHDTHGEHNTSVLRMNGFYSTNIEEKYILCNILLPRKGLLKQNTSGVANTPRRPSRSSVLNNGPKTQDQGHVHENDTAHICTDFIRGHCKHGAQCANHHCSMPYQWQYKDCQTVPPKWQSFPEVVGEKLEDNYCTPSKADKIKLQLQRNPFGTTGREVVLDLENMTMTSAGFTSAVNLRRLSTKSYVTNPDDPLATTWIWYWQDDRHAWKTFGGESEDERGTAQCEIETAFLKESTSDYDYRTPQHTYSLFFRVKPMYQRNQRIATRRVIRRRPVFRHKDDVQQLKSKQHQTSAQSSHTDGQPSLPLHWSPIPQDKDFKRVRLSPNSQEFKKVEKRFRETMAEDQTILIKIERVQNAFLWEKFNRKKDKMKTKYKMGSLEKDLFHGTNPNIVESICKENFDWRLCGKNATMYGQGSYFALNASYSDNYTREGGNDSNRFLFLAKVLVGSYVKGDRSMRRPPAKNPSDPTSDLFDSCVNNKHNPEIFVVFDIDQCYPSYLIEYSPVLQDYGVTAVLRNLGLASLSSAGVSSPSYPSSQSPSASSYSNPVRATASSSSHPLSQSPSASSYSNAPAGATASSLSYRLSQSPSASSYSSPPARQTTFQPSYVSPRVSSSNTSSASSRTKDKKCIVS